MEKAKKSEVFTLKECRASADSKQVTISYIIRYVGMEATCYRRGKAGRLVFVVITPAKTGALVDQAQC